VMHERLFGMGQSKAHQWMYVRLPARLAALRTLSNTPARSLQALAKRLGVSEAGVETVVTPLEEAPAGVPASPLLPMTAPNGVLSVPKTRLHRQHVTAFGSTVTQQSVASRTWTALPMVPLCGQGRSRRVSSASRRFAQR
jgi:hypothetical protein